MEDYLLQIGVFIFGTIIGSFLNVVILRYGQKSLNGRSACPNCDHQLKWFELIPVISYVFLRGKCRQCCKKISCQYPLVELITGLIFLLTFIFVGAQNIIYLIYLWVIFSILIVIFVYDLYHKIIPDLLVFVFIGFSLISVICGFDTLSHSWWQFFLTSSFWAGPILAFPFAFLWFISKGQWIGFGDAKLSLGIGWFLGLVGGSSAIILGVWLGAAIGVFLVFLSKVVPKSRLSLGGKTFTIKSELPLAPFLIIGIMLVFFFGWDIWGLGPFLL